MQKIKEQNFRKKIKIIFLFSDNMIAFLPIKSAFFIFQLIKIKILFNTHINNFV